MQPDDKTNPFAAPSAWGRAPQQVFAIGPLPKPIPRRPAPPPRRPETSILSGSALPLTPAAPKPAPEPIIEAPTAPPQFAPAFIPAKTCKSRTPLFVGGAVAAILVGGAAIAMLGREQPTPELVAAAMVAEPAPIMKEAEVVTTEPAPKAAPVRRTVRTQVAAAPPPDPAPEPVVIATPEPLVIPPVVAPQPAPPPRLDLTRPPPAPVDPNAPITTKIEGYE
jgi:nicotinate-nucleotide--dimethylbenzimidazole phosphoribosyltransferase